MPAVPRPRPQAVDRPLRGPSSRRQAAVYAPACGGVEKPLLKIIERPDGRALLDKALRGGVGSPAVTRGRVTQSDPAETLIEQPR